MPSIDFDSFLNALCSSVNNAQKNIEARQVGVLKRLIETNKEGETQSVTWMFCLQSDEKGDNDSRSMEMPLLSLRSKNMLPVSEVSIEFDCEVSRPDRADSKLLNAAYVRQGRNDNKDVGAPTLIEENQKESLYSRLVLVVKKWHRRRKSDRAKVEIKIRSDESPQGEVLVDGQLLKKFGG